MKHILNTAAVILGLTLVFILPGKTQEPPEENIFEIALTGDSILTRRLSVYNEPEYLKMIEIIRSADVALTNLEVLFHDYESYPMHQSGGTYMRAEPFLARELVWAGFDMVSRANNHAGDYGIRGMRLTTKYVEEAGLVHAGVGNSLTQAREAKFLETGKARVALISCASTFPDHSQAGKSRGDIPARPGLNPLRMLTTYVVTRPQFEMLREMHKDFGEKTEEKEQELRFLRTRFVPGDKTDIRTEPHKQDLEEIVAVVKNASRMADYTIIMIHAHEGYRDRSAPAQFLIPFAHAMIDAGADVVAGHGPHVLRGIEIYKGKPIFYSLGNFIFQNETLLRLPPENYEGVDLGPEAQVADFNEARYDHDRKGFPATPVIWESVVAVPVFKGKALHAVKLYPISLGFGKPRTVRGRPTLASHDLARKIIEDIKQLSKPFGVIIDFKNGIGELNLPESPQK